MFPCARPADSPSRRPLKMPSPKDSNGVYASLSSGRAGSHRLGGFRALHTMNRGSPNTLLTLSGISGASPHQVSHAFHSAFFPFNASPSHPPSIPKPPMGVIAPIQRIFVNAKTYKEPLKRIKPQNMSQNASRGNGSHREITKRTTACTRLYKTPVCQIDSVPSASNRERNAWAPKAPKATAKKPLKAATALDKW